MKNKIEEETEKQIFLVKSTSPIDSLFSTKYHLNVVDFCFENEIKKKGNRNKNKFKKNNLQKKHTFYS